jgi:hypothetical protein
MIIRQDNADKALSNLAKMTGAKIDMYNAKKYLNSMVGKEIQNCETAGELHFEMERRAFNCCY